ncbi:MAG: hypothetical protein JWP87_890, partial [Labilithrix sp.]|nr:hypothetical protein [Labilithrix sp.]
MTSMQEEGATLGNLATETTLRHVEAPEPAGSETPIGVAVAMRAVESLRGELAFVSAEAQLQRTAELLGEGAIVVEVASPAASIRGRLGEHVDYLVERALGIRGAPSPHLEAWSTMPDDDVEGAAANAGARLADQLFRARSVGATAIAIAVGSLSRIAAPALTPEDSATLRLLAVAAKESAVVVLLDDGDEELGAYEEPVALAGMLGVRKAEAKAEAGPEAEANAEAEAKAEANAEAEAEAICVVEIVAEADAVIAEVCVASEPELVETHVDAPVAPVEIAPRLHIAAPVEVERGERVERVEKKREAARRRQTVGVPVSGPSDYWRGWAIALGAARGPQPLASFERLFVESYMPLANAIAAGLEDPRAVRAHDEFREGFERTYADAFVTFGATGRRPRLVMDAYDVALKQARLHNARTTHVLIVDAMRHDLGAMVRNELAT